MAFLFIALLATSIGAISGVGGGVIIKPILDLWSTLDARTISLLSAFTVLSMALSSIIQHIKYKTPIAKNIAIPLAIGALIGGVVGENILSKVATYVDSSTITMLQNLGLMILLLFVLVYMNWLKKYAQFQLRNSAVMVICGSILGICSTFLGIGGGPINVVALTLLFSMNAKQAAINSIILILFSQSAKILSIAVTSGFASYDLLPLVYMIPAGILGGWIGAKLYKKMSNIQVLRVFNVVLVFIISMNIVNILS